jgi:hypothetical protein
VFLEAISFLFLSLFIFEIERLDLKSKGSSLSIHLPQLSFEI